VTAIKVTVTGGREAALKVEGLGERARDTRPAMREVADHLRGVHSKAFASGGGNLPKPWRGLKPSTVEAKRRRGFDRRVLVRRGDLAQSLSIRGHRWNREDIEHGGLRFGTSSPVARLLRARGRNPVQVPRDERPIIAILRRHVMAE
jgi:hypothetical protein